MRGLNLILSICMGSSFNEVVEGWVAIVGEKLLCVANGAKLFCVVNVGSCASLVDVQRTCCHIKQLV